MNISGLAREINRSLELYSATLDEDVETAAEEAAKEAATMLKNTSPKRTGKYANSWIAKKVKGKWVVHNKRYQLTHLLEKPHAKIGGGLVQPIVHIKPVEQQAIAKFIGRIEEAARG